MANKYYYLVASLPYLNFEDSLPVSTEDFLQECKKWLTDEDLRSLETLDIDNFTAAPCDSSPIKEWKAFDSDLRKALAHARNIKKENTEEKIPLLAQDIMAQENPLLMEKAVVRKRWDFIDESELGRHFDLNILQLYYLKLQLLKRLAVFETEKGKSVFKSLSEGRV